MASGDFTLSARVDATALLSAIRGGRISRAVGHAAGRKLELEMRRLFKKPVSNWRRVPRVSTKLKVSRDGSFSLEGWIDNEAFYILNVGARRGYTIYPRTKRALSFTGGTYKASTSPGTLSSSNAGAVGVRIAVSSVRHPGFKGRKFDEQIADKLDKVITQIVSEEYRKQLVLRGLV